jgi:hypothetical protein
MTAIPADREASAIEPDGDRSMAADAPLTDSEQYLAELWTELIGLEELNRSDEFLDVGGNSLTLNLVLTRIEAERGVVLDPEPFFEPGQGSLAAIAGHLDAALAASAAMSDASTS